MKQPGKFAGLGRSSWLLCWLILFLLLGAVGCAENLSPTNVSSSPHVTPNQSAPSRNHVPQSGSSFFVSVTFTQQTSYEQAEQALREKGIFHYPMDKSVPCGNLQNLGLLDPKGTPCPIGTPMTKVQLQAVFSRSHRLLAHSRSWEMLDQLASDSRVVSVDPYPLPQ